jgi:hypothetical protein
MQFRIIFVFRYAKQHPHSETVSDTVSSPPRITGLLGKKPLSKG